MDKNKKIGLWVGGIIVLAAAFYGGVVYGRGQAPMRGQGGNFGQNSSGNFALRGQRNSMGGFTTGQIISKDDKSITVSLMSGGPGSATGGSKIIFLDSSTKISKSVDGTTSDLATGTSVVITGTPNSDGSINAQTIQIRPETPQALTK